MGWIPIRYAWRNFRLFPAQIAGQLILQVSPKTLTWFAQEQVRGDMNPDQGTVKVKRSELETGQPRIEPDQPPVDLDQPQMQTDQPLVEPEQPRLETEQPRLETEQPRMQTNHSPR